jgi:hypothetical protein
MIAWETGTIEDATTIVGARGTEHGEPAYGDYHWLSPGKRTLRPRDAGDDVKYLQSRLDVLADGYFGPETAQALAAFRRAHGLTDEAVAGREVWSLLMTTSAVSESRRRRWWPAPLRAAR